MSDDEKSHLMYPRGACFNSEPLFLPPQNESDKFLPCFSGEYFEKNYQLMKGLAILIFPINLSSKNYSTRILSNLVEREGGL